jgi:hypothetical protein
MSERPIERWNAIRSTGGGDGVIEVPSLPSDIETGFGPIRFAIGPEGQPRLLVPCGPATTVRAKVATSKLSVSLSRFTTAGRSVLFIDVMSIDRALDAVFAELADEIVHRVANGEVPLDAVEGTVADFRELLLDAADREVADHQILGLIGELVVMQELVAIAPAAIEAWTGPYEQRHDFRRREHALEVKTSSRADATAVTISSSEQLSEPAGGSLLLVHVKVERADRGRICVADLAAEIVRSGASAEALNRGLSAMGCLDPYSAAWNRIRFGLEGVTAYQVTAGFPRITSAQFPGGVLPVGIESLSYVVDLAAANPFRVSAEDTEAAFKRIVQ